MSAAGPAPLPPIRGSASSDLRTAFRNSVKLGLSLITTWGVALVVRLVLPRHLGPERFGLFNFADSFAATCLGFLSFGIDQYIQKEVPVRPAHASDFFGGAVLIRSILGLGLLGGLQLVLVVAGRPAEAKRLVFTFGVGYLLANLNNSLAALLQANTTVSELAVVNVVVKLVWGGAIGAGILTRAPLEPLAAAFVLAEAVRATALYAAVRRHLDLRIRVDRAATWAVIVASLPFYANSLTVAVGSRLDVTLVAFLTKDDHQVGWYSAAANLASLTFLLAPLMNSVLLPLMSRAHARSAAELWSIVHRVSEGLLTVAAPIALFIALGADTWIRVVFGGAYAPAALSLRALAPHFVLTYIAVLFSMALIVRGKGWALASSSVSGLVANPVFAVVLVPVCGRLLGPGGGGAGVALSTLASEVVVIGLLIWRLGGETVSRRTAGVAVRIAVLCGLVVGLHVVLLPWGPWRLPVDALAYAAGGLLLRVFRPAELRTLAREVVASRRTA